VNPALVWFRQDLRLQDNPALAAARERGGAVVPVYILDEAGEGGWAPGAASRWWLHHSLAALDAALRARGSRLVLARGPAREVLERLRRESGADAVYWNRRYEPAAIARDRAVRAALAAAGAEVRSFNAALLHEPDAVANRQGGPFQVFSPYWRHCLTLPVEAPVRLRPGPLPAPERWPTSASLADFRLRPRAAWDGGLAEAWEPGEAGGARRLRRFAAAALAGYDEGRDRPGEDGTSRISPWLHFGEVGPRQAWRAVRAQAGDTGVFPPSNGARVFLSELGWREFAHHLLYHFPTTPEKPLRPEFGRFPWAPDPQGKQLRAWQRGRTGYPIVDAGMRQLWRTGWMHNRVRMIVASFLVKHLLLPWNRGAEWFWDTLVDADLANNTVGWQWSAGCGADAAPFFRIFAPVRQGEKFDPEGAYVRRWVPELGRLPAEFVHQPWVAPAAVLAAAGVRLGENYPPPVVDHAWARDRALAAFRALRASAKA